MTTITLSRPITSIDREMTELTLREPNGHDLVKSGYPIRFGASEATEVDAGAMTILIGRLAGVPYDVVAKLPVGDWNACMGAVMGFFGASPAPTS